jgi:hypothetical protein
VKDVVSFNLACLSLAFQHTELSATIVERVSVILGDQIEASTRTTLVERPSHL